MSDTPDEMRNLAASISQDRHIGSVTIDYTAKALNRYLTVRLAEGDALQQDLWAGLKLFCILCGCATAGSVCLAIAIIVGELP